MECESRNSEEEMCGNMISENSFYSNAAQYWSQVPPTVDGMLGGFGMISQTDISGSDKFLKIIYKVSHKNECCRSGIHVRSISS